MSEHRQPFAAGQIAPADKPEEPDNEDVAGLRETDVASLRETIAAIATPPGRGGIGVVRLSGPRALGIAGKLIRRAGPLAARRPSLAEVLDPYTPQAAPIDTALVTYFVAPHSYTGEDVVEIAAHGSPVVLDAILRGAVRQGARLARPGEFTERAFFSGRLDLTEAEAVHDLVAAHTLDQARTAASQLGGAISRRVAPAKEQLLHVIALLEAGMDFASGELDDVDVVPPGQIDTVLRGVLEILEALAASFRGGHLRRTGAAIALIGRPNAGKSSLFNRLLSRERAIVTPLPGTTRDTVEESFELAGIPVRLVDTAGLRLTGDAPADAAEEQGMARSREALADADVVLLVFDGAAPHDPEEFALVDSLAGRPHLLVRNKADLLPDTQVPDDRRVIGTSALTGEGLDTLRAAILQQLNAQGNLGESGALNTERQYEAVSRAIEFLQVAKTANAEGVPHEALLLDLHGALRSLDELTGETTTDDILGRIFSMFCIGK